MTRDGLRMVELLKLEPSSRSFKAGQVISSKYCSASQSRTHMYI